MRTAEGYFYDYCEGSGEDAMKVYLLGFKEAVNEARKEAIEECAALVIPDGNPEIAINKIYSLINELK